MAVKCLLSAFRQTISCFCCFSEESLATREAMLFVILLRASSYFESMKDLKFSVMLAVRLEVNLV